MIYKYHSNLSMKDKIWHYSENPNACSFAYERLMMHLRAARIQANRIQFAEQAGSKSMPAQPNISNETNVIEYLEQVQDIYASLFLEVHFYLVAWVNCGSMMKVIAAQPDYKEASRYYQTVRKHFDHYGEARNSFEHFHDRLPGGKYEKIVKEVCEPNAGPRKIFSGWKKGKYTFSDKEWDVTWGSFELLDKIVGEFMGIVHRCIEDKYKKKAKTFNEGARPA